MSQQDEAAAVQLGHFRHKAHFLHKLRQLLRDATHQQSYDDLSFTLAPSATFLNLSKTNRFRKACIKTILWKPFDCFFLVVIIVNCITLALDDPSPAFPSSTLGRNLAVANYVFIALFTVEAVLKIIALGFVLGPNTYLRNGWNCLDFLVVCVSFLDFTSLGNLTAVRCVRALRPLRAVTRIPQLVVLVETLVRSLPMIADVGLLLLLYLVVFGVVGVQLYAGRLDGRCAQPDFSDAVTDAAGLVTGVRYVVDSSRSEEVCAGPSALHTTWFNSSSRGLHADSPHPPSGMTCPPASSGSPWGYFCSPSAGGMRNFDTILAAWLAVFQSLTATDWAFIMYDCQDAVSWWVWPLHFAMVILGALFLVNLALAVLYLFFSKERAAQEEVGKAADLKHRAAAALPQRPAAPLQPGPPEAGEGGGRPTPSRPGLQRRRGPARAGKQQDASCMALPQPGSTVSQGAWPGPGGGLRAGAAAGGAHWVDRPSQEADLKLPQPVGGPGSRRGRQESEVAPGGARQRVDAAWAMERRPSVAARSGQAPAGVDASQPAVSCASTPAPPPQGPAQRITASAAQVHAGGVNPGPAQPLPDQLQAHLQQQQQPGHPAACSSASLPTTHGGGPAPDEVSAPRPLLDPDCDCLAHAADSTASALRLMMGCSGPDTAAQCRAHQPRAARDSTLSGGQARPATVSRPPSPTALGPGDPADCPTTTTTQPAPCSQAVPVRGARQRCSGRWRHLCHWLAVSSSMEALTTCVIITNAAALALVWYGMPAAVAQATSWANYAFTAYFVLELASKLCGLGLRAYVQDGMNVFDALVTVAGAVDVALELSPAGGALGSYLLVLRAFRLLRVFRLARSWKSLNRIIQVLLSSVSAVCWLTLLLLLAMFIWSLLGMQFFGYQLAQCDAVEGSLQLCPPGLSLLHDCPKTLDCYLACSPGAVGTWFAAPGSPYGGQAYCERFPRSQDPLGASGLPAAQLASPQPEYWAQVGAPSVPRANFDGMLHAFITVFQILTLDNWADALHSTMAAVSEATALYYVGVIIVGVYMVLNLFLAILLDNLDKINDAEEGHTQAGQGGGPAGSALTPGGPPDLHATVTPLHGTNETPAPTSHLSPTSGTAVDALAHGSQLNSLAAPDTTLPAPGLPEPALPGRPPPAAVRFTTTEQSDKASCRSGPSIASRAASMLKVETLNHSFWVTKAVAKAGAARQAAQLLPSSPEPPSPPAPWSPPAPGPPAVRLLSQFDAPPPTGRRASGCEGGGLATTRPPAAPLPWPLTGAEQAETGSPTRPSPPRLSPALPGAVQRSLGSSPLQGGRQVQQQGQEGGAARAPGGQGQPHSPPCSPRAPPACPGPVSPDPDVDPLPVRVTLAEMLASTALDASFTQPQPQPCSAPGSSTAQYGQGSEGGGTARSGSLRPCPVPPLPPPNISASTPTEPSPAPGGPAAAPGAAQSSGLEAGQVALAARASPLAARSEPGRPPGPPAALHSSAVLAQRVRRQSMLGPGPAPGSRHASLTSRQGSGALGGKPDPSPLQPRHASTTSVGLHGPKVVDGSSYTQLPRPAPKMLQPLVLNAPDVGTEFHMADLLHGRSLGCLGPSHPLRCAAAKLVANRWFEQLMLALILASSVELALDGPTLPPDSLLKRAINVMDIIFCAVFGLEVLLKVVVMGLLFNGKGSYLRSAWNCLDFAVAVVSILVLVLEAVVGNTNLVWLRAFRALRALRPLRAASRLEGIRIVVSAMLKAVPALGDILLVGLLFYFIFAVLFVNLLMGSMFACLDSSGGGDALDARYLLPDGAHLNRTWCLAAADGVNITSSYYHSRLGVEVPPWSLTTSWSAPFLRFDNVAQAIWTLFQMASLEGWSDVMHQAGDATGPEQQPVRDANIYISLLCILFIVVGSFFIINMIIGVTIDKFNRMKQEQGGSVLLTEQQKQWLNIQKMLTATQLPKKQAPPVERWRRPFYALTVTWPGFDQAMLAVILMNVAVMCMVHAGMSSTWMAAMSASNVVFTAIFVLELVLKCVAVGVPAYLRVGWNVFDALVVVISVAGVLLDYCTPADLTLMPLLRILRLLRVFKLIPQAKGLRTLMQTLLWSLPALANVGAMLMMFMFMYSVMAMNLFGHIKFQQNITRHANFRTFPVAMITLFRCITGENWNALMQDTMLQDSCVLLMANVTVNIADKALQLPAGTYLDKDADAEALAQLPAPAVDDQCSILPALSILFFISFMLLCSYLLLQLIIAVVLDSIQLQYNQETLVIQQDHMWAFIETWEKLDEYGDGFIDVWELTSLLSAVPPPMGVKGMDQTALHVQQIVLDVDIPLRGCRVHFLECLHALAGRVAGAELPQEEEYRVHDRLVQRLPRSSQPPKYNAGHYYSAQYIKGAVKGFLVRLQLEPLWEAAEKQQVVARQAGGRVKG